VARKSSTRAERHQQKKRVQEANSKKGDKSEKKRGGRDLWRMGFSRARGKPKKKMPNKREQASYGGSLVAYGCESDLKTRLTATKDDCSRAKDVGKAKKHTTRKGKGLRVSAHGRTRLEREG